MSTILNEIKNRTKGLTREAWAEINTQKDSFFDDFPFFDDPKFKTLTVIQKRFLLAWSLKDLYGFRQSDAYRFASQRVDVDDSNACKSGHYIRETPNVKYFVDKMDWMQVENMGFSTRKIVTAETELAYSDITEYIDDEGCFLGNLKELPGGIRRAIKSFEILEHFDKQGNLVKKYKIQLWDKGASLQRMEKIKGMHIDTVNIKEQSTTITGEMSPADASKAYQEMMKGR